MRGSLPCAGSSAASATRRERSAWRSGKKRRSISDCSRERSGLNSRPIDRPAHDSTQSGTPWPPNSRAKSAPMPPTMA